MNGHVANCNYKNTQTHMYILKNAYLPTLLNSKTKDIDMTHILMGRTVKIQNKNGNTSSPKSFNLKRVNQK